MDLGFRLVSEPEGPACLHFPSVPITGAHHTGLLLGCSGSSSGPHVCIASTLPAKLLPLWVHRELYCIGSFSQSIRGLINCFVLFCQHFKLCSVVVSAPVDILIFIGCFFFIVFNFMYFLYFFFFQLYILTAEPSFQPTYLQLLFTFLAAYMLIAMCHRFLEVNFKKFYYVCVHTGACVCSCWPRYTCESQEFTGVVLSFHHMGPGEGPIYKEIENQNI